MGMLDELVASDLLPLSALISGILCHETNEFLASKALVDLFDLDSTHDFEGFKKVMNSVLSEGKSIDRLIQIASKSQITQTCKFEYFNRLKANFYELVLTSATINEKVFYAFRIEDHTVFYQERQLIERLALITEQFIKQTSDSYLTTDDICDIACKMAIPLIGKSDLGSFLRLKENYLSWPTLVGYDEGSRKFERIRYEDSLQWILSKDSPEEVLRIDDLSDLPEILPLMFDKTSQEHIMSLISAPVHFQGTVYGFLNVDSTVKKCFTDFDIMIMNQFIYILELTLEKNTLAMQLNDTKARDTQTGLRSAGAAEIKLRDILAEKEKLMNVGLILVDLMGLSVINDRYGWNVGNEAIVSVSQQLENYDYSNDESMVFRLSADQFLILVMNPTQMEGHLASLSRGLRQFYAEGSSVTRGKLHIPVVLVSDTFDSQWNSLREMLTHLRGKITKEKDQWRHRMPIF